MEHNIGIICFLLGHNYNYPHLHLKEKLSTQGMIKIAEKIGSLRKNGKELILVTQEDLFFVPITITPFCKRCGRILELNNKGEEQQ